jgi:hypothetical protein
MCGGGVEVHLPKAILNFIQFLQHLPALFCSPLPFDTNLRYNGNAVVVPGKTTIPGLLLWAKVLNMR